MERRSFVKKTSLSAAGLLTSSALVKKGKKDAVEFLNPLNRVPVSFIIDDSTALVNLAYYGIPQFQEVFPDRYKQDWRSLPQEIPDSFVLKFLEWCDAHGVKGKYSMVPYPACTGWLNRFIPGWTKKELDDSIAIIRDLAQPNWDIHSEMISHTRVIDTKTGLPFPQATPAFMENWEWSQEKSADELGEYIAYSLQILKDAGLHCDGVTTPGGFATRNIPNLAKGTQYAVKEVYGGQIAHFFRNLYTEPGKSVQPEIFHAKDLGTKDASCSVHIIGCTGDWFGGWDGLTPGDPDKFITPDLSKGRMVEVIESGEPAIMVCHWPGIYYNGEELGFNIFKTVVDRLHQRYDHLTWMKLSEIARYWAAKEHTEVQVTQDKNAVFTASFATKKFTVRLPYLCNHPVLSVGDKKVDLELVGSINELESNRWYVDNDHTIVCFDLEQGKSIILEA
ncbi:MAG: hypothetical protein HKN87_01495 [Saprospiraceae bacterium]|nr:hypothetical protein [Saprospiraceae bacterium]